MLELHLKEQHSKVPEKIEPNSCIKACIDHVIKDSETGIREYLSFGFPVILSPYIISLLEKFCGHCCVICWEIEVLVTDNIFNDLLNL